jgi:dynein heavy chain 2, cytosolic
MVLKAMVMKDGSIQFTQNLTASSPENKTVDVLFVKRVSTQITPDNISALIDVQTLRGSPLDSIYNSLKNVWCPTLLQNSQWTDKLPPKVQQLLSELESSLSSSIRSDSHTESSASGDIENVCDIFVPSDEIRFWSNLKDNRRSSYKNLAKKIDGIFNDISNPGYNELDSMTMEGVSDLVQATLDALNNAWLVEQDNQYFPQKRMAHFFDCIGSSVVRFVQKQFQSINVWRDSLTDIRMSLLSAINLCDKWIDVPRKLTTTFWTGGSHAWKGKPHIDVFATAFKERLEHVLRIRVLSDELSQLLSNEERQSFRLENLFVPLEETQPLLYNPYTEPLWKKAIALYDRLVDPVESAVASHFRRNISPLLDRPQILLREFQKYQSLLERPKIRRELVSERETLLSLLKEVVKKLESAVDRLEQGRDEGGDESMENIQRTRLLSPRIAGIVYLRQIGAKIASIVSTSQSVLHDLDGYSKFSSTCESVLSRIKAEEDNRYDTWLTDIRQKLEDNDSSLQLSGSLMAWKDGVLIVNFPEDLVRFLREIRQLDELGYELPKEKANTRGSKRSGNGLVEKAMEAEKYYRYGILLKKTANFYNSLSEQMIDIQQELLLDSLTAFGNIAARPSSKDDVTWNNPSECEKYIRIVQDAADKLSSENRWLRKIHENLGTLTTSLMNIDLLKNLEAWKGKWKLIKEKVATVRSKYNEKDSKRWILHWDHQVCKALESCYQLGLESLNENLPEIKVEMVFTNRKLEFKPPIEQIRQSYYYEMKKFVGIPNSFDGLDKANVTIYRKIGSRNAKRLQRIYIKAERLFDRLSSILERYSPWTKLATVSDLDAFIEANIIKTDDFLMNLKMLKTKKKEIEKLPDVEKIDCCSISIIPLKVFLDDFLQQVQDVLLIILRRTVLTEFKEVDTFLEYASEKLSSRPRSVDEIGAAKKSWKEIDVKKDSMKTLSKNCLDKKKLLLQYAPGTAVDISEVTMRMANLEGEGGRWDDFDIALEAFNDMVEEQKEALKVTLEDEVITLNENVEKFGSRWRQLKPGGEVDSWDMDNIQKIFNSLDDWKKQFEDMKTHAAKLTESCLTFGLIKPRFDSLENLLEDLATTTKSWDMLKDYYAELHAMSEQDWLTFSTNVYVLQDFATKWQESLKTNFVKGSSSYDNVAEYIFTTVEKIKKSVPALKYCRGEPFKEDHWAELLQGKLNLAKDVRRENVKVEHFLSRLDILMEPNTLSFVKNLQSRALGEVQIREALQELRAWERVAEIKLLLPDESGRKLPLVKDWKDLFVEMGDKQSLLASLKESQFFKAFADQGNALEAKMSILEFVLQTLNQIQRKWVYLEPIFGRGSLPAEEARFKRVDEDFSDIMTGLNRDPKLFSLADIPNLSDKLRTMLDQLERCQKALTEFLEAKRSAMPRFYFIGDDDLLEILGQAKNPNVIQSHLKKLFQGIHKVKFNENSTQITAMVSSANEVVVLEDPVKVNEKVEDWLHELAAEMRKTLASQLVKCLQSSSLDWKYPSQILCLAQSIRFTEDAEVAIEQGANAIDKLQKQLTNTLRDLTSHDLSGEPLMQLKMKSLVFDLVHQIDIVDQIKTHKVSRVTDWYWRKQLRYYLDQKSNIAIIKMHDATFDYTYEYQGNAPRLVHTPLTDKCYLTLTQGMKMGFGGNPYGPAGTGKTESVKALAQCFGRQVLVFNCDEALESTSMVRIFIGIVKCGAWGCFDEFNRLKEDQLSAISQQIQIIQDAIKNHITPITLLNRSIDVDFNSGIFVTLNPAGKGYGGRSRLPDNLKALFRPVAMGAPDNELIAEVSLVTEGFTQSKDLASKIVSLFKLSRQLLSQQQHYDWGLRALKAVLNSGGRIIQSYKSQGQNVTPELENEILIKAVRVNTLSKLTFGDTNKFLALIGDVFPGIQSADISGGELEEAIKNVMKEKPFYLVEDASQIKKMIQLKESLDQRMGCVIVGPSGSGKSSLWRVLKSALIKCGQPVVTYVMNPKSMPRERLLGFMDIDTREWSDGVLTDAARKVVREPSEVKCWIICDGDVDPEWIESLNSVLDDNHLLTLPNGERISFGPNVNFIFETHDLRFASPATVSRMGMIFLSDEDLDVKRLIQRWLNTFPAEQRTSMASWIDELFYRALDFVLRSDTVVETTLVGTVMNGLSQVRDAKTKQEFICGLIRGVGGNLVPALRTTLAKDVFQWASERPPDLSAPLDCYAQGSSFIPFSKDRSDQLIDIRDIGDKAVIPTVSVQRTLRTMESWVEHMEPFILVGPEGCGKSLMIHHIIRQHRNIGITTLHCNAQTSADDIIAKISQSCSLFSAPEGRVYRPRDCERLVLYLKDINLPRPDMYDTCQLIAFLQQLITFDGFYDQHLEFLRLERIQIVASINAATTVGRHALSSRFTAVVRISAVDYPETHELVSVYDAFLSSVISSTDMRDNRYKNPSEREKLATALVDIYQKTREKFTVDDQRHYLFTPRDITLWVKNICRYRLDLDDVIDVVAHEACRIFRDRLVSTEAVNRFDQILSSVLRSSFKYTLPPQEGFYYTSLTSAHGSNANSANNDAAANPSELIAGGKLSRMTEAEFKKLVSQGLMYFEREEKDLNMLLYPEILDHIAHIDRTLSSAKGHLLLVGRTGVGRKNAVTIASYMLGYEFHTPSINRDYGPKSFLIDLKDVFNTAGIKGEHVTVFIEDFQIISAAILEIVNSLISSGEVPGMYTHEELEPLLSPLREKMREEGDGMLYRTPYEFFVSRIKKYVHVALNMDPTHPMFLYRCESNPALYAQCAVMWVGDFKRSSLQVIPTLMDGIQTLVNGDKEEAKEEEGKEETKNDRSSRKSHHQEQDSGLTGSNLVDMIISIHNSCVTSLDATPRDYMVFLQTWYNLSTKKKQELSQDLSHLEAGLSKLESAAEVVNDLRTNAVQQKKDLAIAQAAADRAMEEISKALGNATERRHEVGEVKRTVAENEVKTQQRKNDIEEELAEIQPILDTAKQAVGSIRPEHLNEIRSLNTPPEAIADVLAAVLMMLGVQDLSWLSMKKFLSSRGVKDEILNFDARRMSNELRKNVAKLIKKKSSSFEDATIQRVSQAAAPMAVWVKANIRYSLVIEKIEPLQQELEEEVHKLEESQRRLQRCEEELLEIDNKVAKLKTEFAERTGEAERLKRNLAIAGTTLDKAEGLIGQLSGEQSRWKTQVKQLRSDVSKLPLKMLLAAGFATYLSKTPEDMRESMLKTWLDLLSPYLQQTTFSFKYSLSTESELLTWKAMSLPADDLSQENALTVAYAGSQRVPFIIDPASAATDWLKDYLSRDKSRPLEVVTYHDPRFTNQVELAVRFGKTLLVLEADGVEPMLYPLCRRDLSHQGPRYVVTIGEKQIDYNENFRLFLVTRNPHPELPPDAASLVTQINFTVTKSGLEGQLLGFAIQHEQPEIEKQKGEMLKREEDFKVQLAGLEKNLLNALATAEGNLLENSSLIESLSKTKEKSAEIAEALQASAEASVRLDQQREMYRSFAHTGAKLFFLVKRLREVCHMYQFSLASFINLFKQSLEIKSEKSASIEERLQMLCADIEVRLLYFTGRGLFKSHRLMFALHLIHGMHKDHFQPKEWDIFTGSLVASVSEGLPKNYPSWAPAERADGYRVLAEHLPHLLHALELDNASKWSRFSTSLEAERDIPSLRGITPFQKVLIVQAFRPDRLQSALISFCTDLLRIDSISPPPLSLAGLYEGSSPRTPILLISSPGADPSKELQEYAAKTIGVGNYEDLAMGGGQQDVAIHMLRQAASRGGWLCLKNLHLVISWLPSLEKELSSLEAHPDFRLWLTSEQHPLFPPILLQESLKATYEAPPGIKKNLQGTFDTWDVETFNTSPTKSRLLFLLASFHAVLQERRNYIPQGWTKFYEFSYGDLRAGNYVMEAAVQAAGKGALDWQAIHGLMEDAIYGGRIDNLYDVRVLRAYLG